MDLDWNNDTSLSREARTSSLTRTRIVALVLIAVAVLGLAYIRFSPDPEPLSVPEGARAGDLILEPGAYDTEDGPLPADIGTLVVPENRADPDSRLIALPVIRIRATSDRPAEPIFRLEGGPGSTNMNFEQASRYAEDHDVVLVGYRGVDGSSVLDAPEVVSALSHSADLLGEESMRAYADGVRKATGRFEKEGVDLAGYTLTAEVEDLEAARVALGYDRIDLISESAGTRAAMIYAWRHPEAIHRSIMIGVNPPGNYLWDTATADEQIERYAAHYARVAGPDKRTDDLAATIRQVSAEMPDRWLFLPIKQGNAKVASFLGMFESTEKAGPFSSPLVVDAWLAAADGDTSGLWAATLISDIMFPRMFVWGQYAAVGRIDAQAARAYFSARGPESDANLGYAASSFAWGGGHLADALPADPDEQPYSQVRVSQVETLLIGGELDLSTPPQIATRELLPYLPNGHQVIIEGMGHTSSFWHDQVEAGTRLVNTYLDTGRVDESLYQPGEVDFTPGMTLTLLAKIVLGAMIGLAAAAVLSLLLVAERVYRRGHVGLAAGGVLRSLLPVILGLGGWSLGALVVLTTMPTVPLDNAQLTALCAGAPIGLGIYLAWLDRDRPTSITLAGFCIAMGGALIGARLGFNVSTAFPALLTAIAAATVGANLAVLLLDILLGRSTSPTRSTRMTDQAPSHQASLYDQAVAYSPASRPPVAARVSHVSLTAKVFGPIGRPQTWLSFAYLLLSLVTGIVYFTIAVVGISLSAGSAVLVVGLPIMLGFLGLVRVLSVVEGLLVEWFLGVRIPRTAPTAQAKGLVGRTVAWLKDGRTWTSMLYFILQLPLGIIYFTLVVVGLSVSAWLIAAPIVQPVLGERYVPLDSGRYALTEPWVLSLCVLVGIGLFVGTVHLVPLIARGHAVYAKALLLGRSPGRVSGLGEAAFPAQSASE